MALLAAILFARISFIQGTLVVLMVLAAMALARGYGRRPDAPPPCAGGHPARSLRAVR
jgi:hypothetical protein